MLPHILNISHLNNIRDADSHAGRSLTNSWKCNSFCTKPSSRVSLTAFLRSTTFSRHDLRPAITATTSTPIALQGSNLELCRTAFAAATAVFNRPIPVWEKKLLCVNRGWRTKSWTHATAPFTFSWLIATPSRDTIKTGCNSDGSLTTDAVNWKIWQQHTCKIMRRPIWFWHSMILALFKFREERKPGWLQNAKTLSIGSRDLLPLNLTSRCSRTNKWNSAFAGSISDPLTEPGSSSPSSRCPKRWKNE